MTRNRETRGSQLGLMDELRALPPLHRVLVTLGAGFAMMLMLEGAFTVPYIILRFGWGRS